ncbi:MAG: hypothetical protein M8357_16630 [Desulfobulbaceae bacterium]|nr:hypothetical protein [Desulfobulbaceae bacterium]
MRLPDDYTLLLEWLGLVSFLTFIGSLVAIPWIIARLPINYFIRHREVVAKRHERHPLMAKLIFAGRNSIGILFFMAGVAMLLLPGQGLITILIGISFMDFPAKQQLVETLVRRPRVIRLLNWIRQKEKKPPFLF